MKYHDHSAYVSDVRKRLTQLLKLDGIYISTLILADLIEDGRDLPRLASVILGKTKRRHNSPGIPFV
jgi:hypothetical protein